MRLVGCKRKLVGSFGSSVGVDARVEDLMTRAVVDVAH